MNSIADALRKLHPEMNAKMVFSPERGATPTSPARNVPDKPIQFTLDPNVVAAALTTGNPQTGQGAASSPKFTMGDPLARRLMRRSLQAVALLSLAGIAGVLISSERLNVVSARVTTRVPEYEVALARPVPPLGDSIATLVAPPVQAMPAESMAAMPEAPSDTDTAAMDPIPETETAATGMFAAEPVFAAEESLGVPVEVAGNGQTGVKEPELLATVAMVTSESERSEAVHVNWQPVLKVASVAVTEHRTAEKLSRQEPVRSTSDETIWSGQAAPTKIAEILYESDEPLFEGDFPPAMPASADRELSGRAVKPQDVPMRLEGIFWDQKRPLALIDGEIIEQGATYRGAKVLEIHRTSIVISEKGQTRTLVP